MSLLQYVLLYFVSGAVQAVLYMLLCRIWFLYATDDFKEYDPDVVLVKAICIVVLWPIAIPLFALLGLLRLIDYLLNKVLPL